MLNVVWYCRRWLTVALLGWMTALPVAAAPDVSLSPASIAFGPVLVGTVGASQVVTLTNVGTSDLTILFIITDGDYSRSTNCSAGLIAGGKCTISIAFTPGGVGERPGTLYVHTDAPNSPHVVNLTGSGSGGSSLAPNVSLSPQTVNFGDVNVGSKSPAQPVVITNTGTGVLNLYNLIVDGDYSFTSDCPLQLTSGKKCTMQITFTPLGPGSRPGSLIVFSDAPTSPASIGMSGNGVNQSTGTGVSGSLSASPSALSFASQLVNTTSTDKVITLTNTSLADVSIFSVIADGDFASTTTCGNTLIPGDKCTVSINFTPAAEGDRSGSLTVHTSAADSPTVIALQATAVEANPLLAVDRTAVDFQATNVGSSSTIEKVIVTNGGNTAVDIGAVTSSSPRFEVAGSCANASLQPAASCSIQITFTPLKAGQVAGTISIENKNGSSPVTIDLTGIGMEVTTTETVEEDNLKLDELSIDFATVGVHLRSALRSTTIKNVGTNNIKIKEVISSSTEFTGSTDCQTLEPGQSCTAYLNFVPATGGARTATLTFKTERGTETNIDLLGQGGDQTTLTGAAYGSAGLMNLVARFYFSNRDAGGRFGRYYVAVLLNGQAFFYDGRTWIPYTEGMTFPYHTASTLAAKEITVLNNASLSGLVGAQVVIGWGLTQDIMLSKGQYRVICTISTSDSIDCPIDGGSPF